jgi:RNA polymerase sigma-70 factor (ECF subfamily)
MDSYDDSLRFSPWIFRIAQNLAVDWLRKRKPVVSFDDGTGESGQSLQDRLASTDEGPLQMVEYWDTRDTLERVLQELPANYRAVLLLRYAEEMSYEDMANALDMPVTTIKTRLHRAREQLRQRLSGYGFFND